MELKVLDSKKRKKEKKKGTLETVVQVLSYQNLFFGKIFNPILNIQCLI